MALEAKDLVAGYGDIVVLQGVSVAVPTGMVAALLGSNGAGKTTALNAISGLVASVSAGEILVDGADLRPLSPHECVEVGIAHVPRGRQLFPFMSVRENLLLGPMRRAAAAMKPICSIGCSASFRFLRNDGQTAGSLSGGEQQMCAIARGLMSRPRYLLLDELSLGLAPIIVKRVMNVVSAIAAQGIGVLLVEQNVALALKLAQHAYVLEHATVAIEGTAASLLEDDRARKAYVGL
jgi:branched-chain amino acid transport system ATP-binding protein